MSSPTTTEPDATASGPVWHTLSVSDALQHEEVDPTKGLSPAEAETRLQKYGPNAFAQAEKEPGWRAFLRQFRDPMQIVLLVAGAISGIAIQQWATAVVLIGLAVFNAVLSLRQEGKAEASVAALQKMLLVKTRVRRGGETLQIPADQVVPGDIVLFEAGDRVPADGRLIRAATVEIDESALTGESAPVPKLTEPVEKVDTPLGDRVDMAYMNTNVTRGSGELLVTATGMSTEVGHISGLLQATKLEETPLTKQLNVLTGQIITIAVVALAISLLIGRSRDTPRDLLFLTGVAFAISAIPTGLPAVVTYLLATGTTTLAAAGAIVKRLRSVETLGATSAINSDKTGTLTLNQMTAVEMATFGQRYTVTGSGYGTDGQITRVGGQPNPDLEPYLLPMALASDAVAKDGALVGDPTEGALVVLAAKGGIDATTTREEYPRVATLPFDAAYKLMATFHHMKDESGKDVIRCFVKGAPDQLLARASSGLGADQQTLSVDEGREKYLAYNESLGKQGLRVMAIARKDFDPASFNPDADLLPLIDGLTLLALVGIVDPPRPEARTAIAKARAAGIQVRMITGDHAVTAAAIAEQLGIPGRAISGAEFEALSDEQAQEQIDEIGVIARVAPEDKVRLVNILKKKGNIVAMTGDGVNDAPALKTADIGVAMGITGTDVSKEAAVMILTDDNFATIVRAVELGRTLYGNLVKYIEYQMGSLFAFILTFLGSALFNILGGIPFLPFQVLWVNFTVNVFEAIGLGLGAPAPGLMERPPRPANERIMPMRLAVRLVFLGLVMGAVTLVCMQYVAQRQDDVLARSIGLTAFSLASIFFALECNDELGSVFSHKTIENTKLMQMSGLSLLATFVVVQFNFMQRIFGTEALDINQWLVCLALGSIVLWVVEIMKIFRRRAAARAEASAAATAEATVTTEPEPAVSAAAQGE
jgi:P-type Ca2+ transporter type 2C